MSIVVREAVQIAVVSGDEQEATVGSLAHNPLVIRVTDAERKPVVGAPVRWEFQSGKGRAIGDGEPAQTELLTYSGPGGEASVLWELGAAAGLQSASAELVLPGEQLSPRGPLGASGGSDREATRVRFKGRGRTGTPASIVVTPDVVVLPKGRATQLVASVRDAHSNLITRLSVLWQISKASVASVSSSGLLVAREPGTTTVSASVDGVSGTASVLAVSAAYGNIARVVAYPDTVVFHRAGETTVVYAIAENSVGEPISGITFEFNSSDSSVAEVDSMGRVTAHALGAAIIGVSALCCGGTDAIVVQIGGSPDTLTITVINQNAVVVSNLSLLVGDSAYLDATASNILGFSLGNVDPTWSSSNPAAASVSSTGVVHALSAGSTSVVASYGGVTATVPTTVTDTVTVPVPPPSSPLYPNRPTGMVMLTQWDGTSETVAGWSTSTALQNHLSVVSNATNPLGTGQVLRIDYSTGENNAGGDPRIDRFGGGPYREIYIMYRIYIDPNWDESVGQKLFYWGADGITTAYYVTREGNLNLRVQDNLGSDTGMTGVSFWGGARGTWVNVELHAVAESSLGAHNGRISVYKNGVLAAQDGSIGPVVGWDGAEWYLSRNGSHTRNEYLLLGEMSFWGK